MTRLMIILLGCVLGLPVLADQQPGAASASSGALAQIGSDTPTLLQADAIRALPNAQQNPSQPGARARLWRCGFSKPRPDLHRDGPVAPKSDAGSHSCPNS